MGGQNLAICVMLGVQVKCQEPLHWKDRCVGNQTGSIFLWLWDSSIVGLLWLQLVPYPASEEPQLCKATGAEQRCRQALRVCLLGASLGNQQVLVGEVILVVLCTLCSERSCAQTRGDSRITELKRGAPTD